MAYCVSMRDEEWKLMKEANAGVSYCANPNFIKSGMANVHKMIDLDLELGTDVADGYSPSVIEALRCSWTRSIARSPAHSLFYLAIMGGARVMELGDTIGKFEARKEFDAILVNTAATVPPIDIFPHDMVQKSMCLWTTIATTTTRVLEPNQ